MTGQFFDLSGNIVTAEEALRAAASFIETDLDSKAGITKGRVAWEYVLRLNAGGGAQFDLRVKIWPSKISTNRYRMARSVHAKAPNMQHPYPGNDGANTILDALLAAVHDTMYPINQGKEEGFTFDASWLYQQPSYAYTPDFGD
ncbi:MULTISPECIES: hypothetical protein [Stenotrophomonas maltophilia group]|uniref:hypothetical protein n=1 Tax=Stenotrophomonas maltophilia group TaxID=995085 RepID=UPI00066CA1F3|nr:hypothetical protein [Stenotrophomonas maltophilia]ASE52222.1 hypothetical protein CEQ03_05325 [Stenotrophomonas maltophilia]EKT4101841.1 hypothetical protein [Stenotrophomonas maltophilia]KOO74804.1 hypothetical protein VK66_20340 [Stenotrophomonas maltophilia]MBH1421302.1 hypothetical protein [Stenotrophomonas maltophilia]MBN5053539.1 hypothetical protein [Stenotrophomonas maltophilia]